MRVRMSVVCLVVLSAATGARAERTLSATVYHDKLAGMWLAAGIPDGIVDVSFNGHLPYWTRTDAIGEAEDWYAVTFDRFVTFTGAVFHEGDIHWADINGNPAEPGGITGGYFTTLTVEVGRDGTFREVAALQLSEPLDPLAFFQHIELTFLPAVGDTLRLRGGTGGTQRFTSIVELEVHGLTGPPTGGDAGADGDVDLDDFARRFCHPQA